METPTTETNPAVPKPDPKAIAIGMLRGLLKMAEKGELGPIAVAYMTSSGGSSVQASPMSSITLNHLVMLMQRKVAKQYDRVLSASDPVSPAGGVPVTRAPEVPRAVRRAVESAQRKAARKAKPTVPNGEAK